MTTTSTRTRRRALPGYDTAHIHRVATRIAAIDLANLDVDIVEPVTGHGERQPRRVFVEVNDAASGGALDQILRLDLEDKWVGVTGRLFAHLDGVSVRIAVASWAGRTLAEALMQLGAPAEYSAPTGGRA